MTEVIPTNRQNEFNCLATLKEKFGNGDEADGRIYWNIGSTELVVCASCGFVKTTRNGIMDLLRFWDNDFVSKFDFLIQNVK